MSKLKQSVGIDLSKDKLDVCFSAIDTTQKVTIKATRKFANQIKGFQELNEWVVKHSDPSLSTVYVMEATDLRCLWSAGPVFTMNSWPGFYLGKSKK